MNISDSQLKEMDEKADQIIRNWSLGALAANLLPPPFDCIAVGAAFARMGARLGEIYGEKVSWSALKKIGKAMAKGVLAVVGAGYVGTGLLKYIPGVNVWIALLVQPPLVAAVAWSVGSAFKQYYHVKISDGRHLTAEEMQQLAEAALNQKLAW